MSVGATLQASRTALKQGVLFQKYAAANPRECARIETYWDNGDVFPSTATPTGLFYSLMAEAYWQEEAPIPFIPV